MAHTDSLSRRAKLFRYDKETNQWKERGTGDIKFLKHKDSKKIRVLMRREKTHKICANHYLVPSLKLAPNVGSDRSWVWTATDFSEEAPTVELLAIRFASPESTPLSMWNVLLMLMCLLQMRRSSRRSLSSAKKRWLSTLRRALRSPLRRATHPPLTVTRMRATVTRTRATATATPTTRLPPPPPLPRRSEATQRAFPEVLRCVLRELCVSEERSAFPTYGVCAENRPVLCVLLMCFD